MTSHRVHGGFGRELRQTGTEGECYNVSVSSVSWRFKAFALRSHDHDDSKATEDEIRRLDGIRCVPATYAALSFGSIALTSTPTRNVEPPPPRTTPLIGLTS